MCGATITQMTRSGAIRRTPMTERRALDSPCVVQMAKALFMSLIYRLARSRRRQIEDVEKYYGVNDEHGRLLIDRKKATEWWGDYFKKISTRELSHPPIPQLPPTYGPIQPITVDETVVAEAHEAWVKRRVLMMYLAAELWKSKDWNPAEWLTAFFNLRFCGRRNGICSACQSRYYAACPVFLAHIYYIHKYI
ncbi:hypothetical protein Y032_0013g2010 [Ancylostoma ceylanicum]|uniref:Uncharacterized protein n=1 Tax=Ancylostoma ceylanicum TaxID=53326 RepID=A0A016VC80_9BILA|nr:hypothetical protein Y032_0013g2010 [Ancylostoma ceylanicum]